MIAQQALWDRVKTLTKTGTSGYFTQDEWNSNIYSVQYAILSLLCDNYENNQKVSDALSRHIKVQTGTTQVSGKLFATDLETNLADYYRGLALNYVSSTDEYPSYKVTVNAKSMTLTSAIRKPNLTKFRTVWCMEGDNIQMYPKQALGYSLIYCKKPLEAKIAFTTAEDEDNDYLVIDDAETIDIDFPEGLFNLFVYYMLESAGIEMKDQLQQEFSQLGINRTTQTDIK